MFAPFDELITPASCELMNIIVNSPFTLIFIFFSGFDGLVISSFVNFSELMKVVKPSLVYLRLIAFPKEHPPLPSDDRSLTQVSFSTGISRLNRRWGPGITRPEILGIQTRFGLETLTWRFQNISPASLVISTSDCASVPLITQTCFIFLGSEDAFF
ncbi:hypothetical protein LXL04_022077 [Taraxacum kok-saghyz]